MHCNDIQIQCYHHNLAWKIVIKMLALCLSPRNLIIQYQILAKETRMQSDFPSNIRRSQRNIFTTIHKISNFNEHANVCWISNELIIHFWSILFKYFHSNTQCTIVHHENKHVNSFFFLFFPVFLRFRFWISEVCTSEVC